MHVTCCRHKRGRRTCGDGFLMCIHVETVVNGHVTCYKHKRGTQACGDNWLMDMSHVADIIRD